MHHKLHSNNQDGVALMLSVLILAAITAIAFSLATIVFIELRASRDLLRSEPALYATLGVTEEALFQYKRYVNERIGGGVVDPPLLDVTICEPKQKGVCNLGGVDLTNPPAELLVSEDVPKVVTVNAGQTVEVPLFFIDNPACPVGDDVCQWTSPYDRLELQLVPIGATDATLTASVNWIDRNGNEGVPISVGSISEGEARLSWGGFQSLSRHQLVLTNNSQSNNMQVSIWSYEDIGINEVEKGLPIIAKRVLKIVADYLGLTRTYRVEIPVGTSNFGS